MKQEPYIGLKIEEMGEIIQHSLKDALDEFSLSAGDTPCGNTTLVELASALTGGLAVGLCQMVEANNKAIAKDLSDKERVEGIADAVQKTLASRLKREAMGR